MKKFQLLIVLCLLGPGAAPADEILMSEDAVNAANVLLQPGIQECVSKYINLKNTRVTNISYNRPTGPLETTNYTFQAVVHDGAAGAIQKVVELRITETVPDVSINDDRHYSCRLFIFKPELE